MKHTFLLAEGTWIGEGKITFSASPESIHFYTKWVISNLKDQEGFSCTQQVEMTGTDESVYNHMTISNITDDSFAIQLNNDIIGKVNGKGLIDDRSVAWEYRHGDEFDGFEVYELQENGDYMFHAEYASTDQYRTVVDGRVWKKST